MLRNKLGLLKHAYSRVPACHITSARSSALRPRGVTSEKPKSQLISILLKRMQTANSNINLTFNVKQPDFIAPYLKVGGKKIKKSMKLTIK